MFVSVSSVAAIAMNVRSRSPGSYSRRIHSIEPSAASVLRARARRRARRARRGRRRRAAPRPSRARSRRRRRRGSGGPSASGRRCRTASPASRCTQVWSQIPRRNWQTHSLPFVGGGGHRSPRYYGAVSRNGRGLLHGRLDAAPRGRRARGGALRAAGAADAGRASGRLRRASSPTPARSTSPTSGSSGRRAVMNTIAFGTQADADRATRARARHAPRACAGRCAEPAGRFPAGTPYAADDPELLLWILACARRLGAARLPAATCARCQRAERDALWRDYRVVGRLFGLARARHAGRRSTDFDAYMRGMLDGGDLYVTPAARELAIRDRDAAAGAAALRGRCSSWSTRSLSGCSRASIRRQYGFCAGIRRARSRCTAARSTSSASSSRCCRTACG